MREDEPDRSIGRQAQLRDDRLEVVAIRAEAVQPDHRGIRGFAGFELDTG
jgi:hypothetical protein